MNQSIKSSVTAGVLALAIVAIAMPTPRVYAATADVEARIQALLAEIQQLKSQQTNPISVNINLTRDLREGMTGADVRVLQQFLNNDPATVVAISGIGSKGSETTYFGPATKAAVIKFQNKYRAQVLAPIGLSQGTGFVGAATRTYINTIGKTVVSGSPIVTNPKPTTPSTPTESIVQEEGDINVTRGSEHTSTLELTGDFDEIYSVQVTAADSAMTINRMDFMFDKKVWRYIDTLVLYQNGEKVADLKVTEDTITEVSNEYRVRFSDLSTVVAKGKKDTFILEAKALQSISSIRSADTLSVYMPVNGVRAVDTAKMTTLEPVSNLGQRTFDFRNAEDDGEIIVSLSKESPHSGVVQVKPNTTSSNTTVLIAEIKAEDSDIEIEKMYVKVDSSEAIVTNVVRSVSLFFGSKTIAKENVVRNAGSAITGTDEEGNTYTIIESGEYYVKFDKIPGITIDEGDRKDVAFKAEFNKQSGRYINGTDVTFTLRAVDGENVNSTDITNGNITTGSNSTFSLYTEGLTFNMISEDADTDGKGKQIGDFTLSFDITAFGEDVYVPFAAARQTGTTTIGTVGTEYSIVNGDDGRYALGVTSEYIEIKNAKKSDSHFKLAEGSTYRVTLQVSLSNAGADTGYYGVALEAFRFKVGSITGVEHTLSDGFDDFETHLVSVRS